MRSLLRRHMTCCRPAACHQINLRSAAPALLQVQRRCGGNMPWTLCITSTRWRKCALSYKESAAAGADASCLTNPAVLWQVLKELGASTLHVLCGVNSDRCANTWHVCLIEQLTGGPGRSCSFEQP